MGQTNGLGPIRKGEEGKGAAQRIYVQIKIRERVKRKEVDFQIK